MMGKNYKIKDKQRERVHSASYKSWLDREIMVMMAMMIQFKIFIYKR
jgi:hypothetical protein